VRPIKILFFQPDFSRYQSAYYQRDFLKALGRLHTVFPYGPGYSYYEPTHTVEEVLRICPFEPDLICFGAGWEKDDHPTVFDPHPAIRVGHISVPKVMILNKEYKKLREKFQYIKENRIQLVFTAHHNAEDWEKEVGVPFMRFPFAVNPDLFKDYGETKSYDIGFSGALHAEWTDVRVKVKRRLFIAWRIKRRRFRKLRIYWGEWGSGHLLGETYARLLNSSRMWLATPSAMDIVGTRFYEVMASKSLLFCSRSRAYDGLFEDGVHCVMFEPDLSDFEERLFHYLQNEEERQRTAEMGHQHTFQNHTWQRRAEEFTEAVLPLVKKAT
jgi:hypothetical protein